jgi:hypothetical protein
MAVRLLVLRAGRPLPWRRFPVLISVRGWVDLRVIARLKGLGQLKNPMTSLGTEPATFQLVAWYLIQLWQSVYGVHKLKMPLPGRRVSAGTLMRNYNATNMGPIQRDKPLFLSKRRPHFPTYKRSWNEHKLGHGSRRASKPRTTVQARSSSNLLDCAGVERTETRGGGGVL